MAHKKKILAVVGNPMVTPRGDRVGFWAAELTHPYYEFTRNGYDVVIASDRGGPVEFDAHSDPRHSSGHSAHDVLTLGYIHSPEFMTKLEDTSPVAQFRADNFDAIFVAGGSSPMFTFKRRFLFKGYFPSSTNSEKSLQRFVMVPRFCFLHEIKTEALTRKGGLSRVPQTQKKSSSS